jgi:uncharacterized protein (TIGR02145 family)
MKILFNLSLIPKFDNPIKNNIMNNLSCKSAVIFIHFCLITMTYSCSKEESKNYPELSTATISEITHNSATSGGNITDDKGLTITSRGVCWSTDDTPTVGDNKTSDGAGAGNFVSVLTGLKGNTTYYVRAYAINSSGTGYGMALSFKTDAVVIDADGNEYPIVKIGTQIWMGENLKTTKYNDNNSITYPGTDNASWQSNTNGAFSWNDNNISNKNIYGALYNWHAVNTGKLCPIGWHIPTNAEIQTMQSFLGSNTNANKLKEIGTEHWISNPYATNETGFTARPAGFRYINGIFYDEGNTALWWLKDEILTTHGLEGYYWNLSHDIQYLTIHANPKNYGQSVRCIKNP